MKTHRYLIIACVCFFLAGYVAHGAVFLTPNNPPPTVGLQWDASVGPNIANYNIYYGVASRSYTNKVSVGNVTNTTINLPTRGVIYFIAATAVNSTGLESDFSNEVTYRPPTVAPPGNVRTNVVQLAMTIEKAPVPTGPWSLYASLGTDLTAPGFFRSVVRVDRGTDPLSLSPPIPGQ